MLFRILFVGMLAFLLCNSLFYYIIHVHADLSATRSDNETCHEQFFQVQRELFQTRDEMMSLLDARQQLHQLRQRIETLEQTPQCPLTHAPTTTTTTTTTRVVTPPATVHKPPVTARKPLIRAGKSTPTRKAGRAKEWHPWDNVPAPPEQRILARVHWHEEEQPVKDYPYPTDASYTAQHRKEMLEEEKQFLSSFDDPYKRFRLRGDRDKHFMLKEHQKSFQFTNDYTQIKAQSENIQDFLHRHQFEQDCAKQRFVLFSFATFNSYGFGAAVRHLVMAFDYALSRNRILIVKKNDDWTYADREQRHLTTDQMDSFQVLPAGDMRSASADHAEFPSVRNTSDSREQAKCGGGWQCYFESAGACDERRLWTDGIKYRSRILCEETRYEKVSLYSSRGQTYDEVLGMLGDGRLRDLYWRSQLTRFLLKLQPSLLRVVNRLPPPSIAMHVRRGDKRNELEGKELSLDVFIDALKQHNTLSRDATVFVATDTAIVVDTLPKNLAQFVVLNEYRPGGAMHTLLRDHKVDRHSQAVAVILNIWLLSQSDTLICVVWSKFCALAFELQYSRDHADTRLIDVIDGYWTPY